MEYNKSQFKKSADKKVLHKVRKHWVVMSTALLMMLGGVGLATQVSARADVNGNQPTLKNQLNQSLQNSMGGGTQTQLSNQPQSKQNNNLRTIGNNGINIHNQTNNINQQADQLHRRILESATIVNRQRNSRNNVMQLGILSYNINNIKNSKSQQLGNSSVKDEVIAPRKNSVQGPNINFAHDVTSDSFNYVNTTNNLDELLNLIRISQAQNKLGPKKTTTYLNDELPISYYSDRGDHLGNLMIIHGGTISYSPQSDNNSRIGDNLSTLLQNNDSWHIYFDPQDSTQTNITQGGNASDLEQLFENHSSIQSANLSGLDTGSASDIGNMFQSIGDTLKSVNFNGLKTHNVHDMRSMFGNNPNLKHINFSSVSGIDSGSISIMGGMFYHDPSLVSVNLSGFNTDNVSDMSNMFSSDSSLISLNLSGVSTAKVNDWDDMFTHSVIRRICLSSDSKNLNSNGRLNLATNTDFDVNGNDISTNDINNPDQDNSPVGVTRKHHNYEFFSAQPIEVYWQPNGNNRYSDDLIDSGYKTGSKVVDGSSSDDFVPYRGVNNGLVKCLLVQRPNGYNDAPDQSPWHVGDYGLIDKLNGNPEKGNFYCINSSGAVVGKIPFTGLVGKTVDLPSARDVRNYGFQLLNPSQNLRIRLTSGLGGTTNMLNDADNGQLKEYTNIDDPTAAPFKIQVKDLPRLTSNVEVHYDYGNHDVSDQDLSLSGWINQHQDITSQVNGHMNSDNNLHQHWQRTSDDPVYVTIRDTSGSPENVVVHMKPAQQTDTINYEFKGKTFGSVKVSGNYSADAGDGVSNTSFTIDNDNHPGLPNGYELINPTNGPFNYDGGTYNVAVEPIGIRYGKWDYRNANSANYTLYPNGTLELSDGPMDTNSWSYAKDQHGSFTFLDDGSDTLPNALNRNSIRHLVFKGNVQLPSDSSELFHNMHNLVDVTGTPDASKVTSMSDMFASDDNSDFKRLDLTNWDVSSVTDMSNLFAGDTHLSDLTLSQTHTPNLSDMDSMFMSDRSLHGNSKSDTNANNHTSVSDIHNLNALTTSGVSDMSDVFASDPNLQGLDLHSWQTSDVTSLNGMFAKDPDLTFLDIQSMTMPQASIASSDQMFAGDFSDSNQMKNQQYAIVMNKDFRVGKSSNLDGYWASPDYKHDLELFSPRQLDLYGAGLGPNQSATWIKKSSQPSQLQRQPVVFYNQVSDQVNNPVVQYLYDPNGADGKSNGLPSISDQVSHLIVPKGYRLPPYVKGNADLSGTLDRFNEKWITNYGLNYQNNPIRINVIGKPETQNLRVHVYYSDQNGQRDQGEKSIPVTGLYGDSDDSVKDDTWYQKGTSGEQGPSDNYSLDPANTKDDVNGRLHYNFEQSTYNPDANAQWNNSEPQLHYAWTQAQLNVIYLNQLGAQVGYTDQINGRAGDQVSINGSGREGVPNGYSLANNQDTSYDLQAGTQTVYLHVTGNQHTGVSVKAYLILQDNNGKKRLLSDHYSLNNNRVGDVNEIDPDDFNRQTSGYSIDASDTPQFVTVESDGVTPSFVIFKYHKLGANDQSSLTVHYITESDREVGSGVITGQIGASENPFTGPQKVTLPVGYHSHNKQNTYNYTLTESPQDVYILVDGNQSSPQLTVHLIKYDRNGRESESDQIKTYKNAVVGSSDDLSPYDYTPAGYHVDPSDQAYHVTVLPNGKLSPGNVTFTYHENYQPSIGTIRIHYVTASDRELDHVSDHGLVNNAFNLAPYRNDLPDANGLSYQATGNVYDNPSLANPLSVDDVQHLKYGSNPLDLYIEVQQIS